jgi:hypothetical protein
MKYSSPKGFRDEFSEIAIIARSFTSPMPTPSRSKKIRAKNIDKRLEIFPKPLVTRTGRQKIANTFR